MFGHFDPDSAVTFARLCEHVTPTLTEIPQSDRLGCLRFISQTRKLPIRARGVFPRDDLTRVGLAPFVVSRTFFGIDVHHRRVVSSLRGPIVIVTVTTITMVTAVDVDVHWYS